MLGFRNVHGPWGAFVCGLVALGFLVIVWRGEWKVYEESFSLRFRRDSLAFAVLASPHLYIHDLSSPLSRALLGPGISINRGCKETTSVLLGILLLCTPFCVDPYLALVPGDSNSAQCRMDERHASCHHCDSQNSLRAGNLLKNQLVSLFKKERHTQHNTSGDWWVRPEAASC